MNLVKYMQKKLFLFDVDGTLYDNANKQVDLSSIKAIEMLKKQGHEIAIATGRARFMLDPIEPFIPLIDHFVVVNGQQVIANQTVIHEETIHPRLIQRLIDSLVEMGITYGFESSHQEAVSEINDRVRFAFAQLDLRVPPEHKTLHQEAPIFQMWCFCDEDKAEQLKTANPEFHFVRWLSVGYDIIKKGTSKGLGVQILASHLGYQKENMVAFGDGDNDIEMMNEVGLGIAMGNGTPLLKKASHYVTSNVNESGIYKALKHFNFINE